MPYTPFTLAIESPCFSVAAKLPQGVTVRVYKAAVDNAATLVSSSVSAALQPWSNGLEIASSYVFDYFVGKGNSEGADLTAYLTAPLMFRPTRGTTPDDAPWGADMVLQPSKWGPKSQPPAPANGFVTLSSFGTLRVAVEHRSLETPPAQADFEACDASLRSVVADDARYTVNATSPHTPTFAFYYPRDDMPPVPAGPFDFECWVAVVPAA
jgi:hypothetical protein